MFSECGVGLVQWHQLVCIAHVSSVSSMLRSYTLGHSQQRAADVSNACNTWELTAVVTANK